MHLLQSIMLMLFSRVVQNNQRNSNKLIVGEELDMYRGTRYLDRISSLNHGSESAVLGKKNSFSSSNFVLIFNIASLRSNKTVVHLSDRTFCLLP